MIVLTGVKSETRKSEFEKAAAEQANAGFFGDLWGFMKENKKWWLVPLIVTLVLFGALVFLAGTGVAPFIYTLF